jgi:hypothetical protein
MTETEIRGNWKQALDTMDITAISAEISWGFFDQDLFVLAALHECGDAGLQMKIYELLEDCNFHTLAGQLKNGEYEDARLYIFNDLD